MRNAIVDWIHTLMVPQERLSGLPICPYAKQSHSNKTYKIIETNYENVAADVEACDMAEYQVVVLYYMDYLQYEVSNLIDKTRELNQLYNEKDIVVLDSDPRDPLILDGVLTTFTGCYLWIVQSLSDLTEKSNQLRKTKYYSHWTQEQLDAVVTWRQKA